MDLDLIRSLVDVNKDTKIVLLVVDGLGGLPARSSGLMTALEAAHTPNLDRLAARSSCGLHVPIATGITPGSGPAHLALFGYDPLQYQVGRGTLSALGIGFDLQPQDVAARGNFCTVDDDGRVTDRRAGRIPTEKGEALCELLRANVEVPEVEIFVQSVKEYRFLLVLRGEGLDGAVNNTDPLEVGERPLPAEAQHSAAERTARLVQRFVDEAGRVLAGRDPANMVLLRGFSQRPQWPGIQEVFGLRGAAIARYPMYRGVASLVGMDVLPGAESRSDEIEILQQHWDAYDFFFVHMKRADSAGEDGDFDRKVEIIEDIDGLLPQVTALDPDVLLVTGDHSTPCEMKYHSWHPVPVLVWSRYCRADGVTRFGERDCVLGALGPRFPAPDLMPLALAHARRLEKFGA